MSTLLKSIQTVMISVASISAIALAHAAPLNFGTPMTPEEMKEFVSPLPDGRGLPPGSGTAAAGKGLYQTQCVACHGVNMEGGIGDRLIGGRGTLVNADPTKKPVKTVESYWPHATTLFDYIKRAMPLNAPGSLSNNDVYALSAYILSEAKIIDSALVVDQSNLATIRMPNRNGFIRDPRPEKYKALGTLVKDKSP